ncbi:MAG: hypothetical protein ABI461_02515 [Polyangiaceae bacterium]
MPAAGVLFTSTSAFAQDTGADQVVLKDGGILRGTLVDVLPGDHATLKLANGQNATIRWDVIDHIIRNGTMVNPNQSPATTTQTTAPTPPTEQGMVFVHVEGADVDLEMQTNGTNAPSGKRVKGVWATMCTAPCDQELPLSGSYRIAGSGVRASKAFKLSGKAGDHILINVDASSTGAFAGGIVLVSVGVPVFFIGTMVELVVAIVNAASKVDNSYTDTSGAQVVGLSMMGLGVAGVITGIVLIAGNGSSKLDQTIATPETKKAASNGGDIFGRTPVWRDHEGPKLPPFQAVPLLTGTF